MEIKRITKQMKKKKQREAEQKRDHLFAAQLQEQERQRGVSLGISARGGGPSGPGSPSRASGAQQPRAITPQVQLVRPMEQGGEPHVEEFGNEGGGGAVIEYYQADEFGEGMEGGNGNGARPNQQRNRPISPKRRSGCCGCSDRCWCCMCCFFLDYFINTWCFHLVLGSFWCRFKSWTVKHTHVFFIYFLLIQCLEKWSKSVKAN